jgi:hypothetical protein
VTHTSDLPPGMIAVRVPKAVLSLTHAEYVRAIRHGEWWRCRQAKARRTAKTFDVPAAPTVTGNESDYGLGFCSR